MPDEQRLQSSNNRFLWTAATNSGIPPGALLPGNPVSPDAQAVSEDDTIIAVMGTTGAGKSTFIKVATGTEDVQVGHSLNSCTMNVQAVRCRDLQHQRDVVFVDTPGFDDTTRQDTEILEGIADWLQKTYRAGVQLSGVLYLHRITDNRVTSTGLRNLDMFNKFCGNDALSNVVLVTTQWDQLRKPEEVEEGIRREEELRNKFWRPFLNNGSQMQRFDYSRTSAWNIVNSLPLVRKPLEIQREMVDQGKRLEDTAAGLSLFSWFHTAAQTQRDLFRRLGYFFRMVTSSGESQMPKGKPTGEHTREARQNANPQNVSLGSTQNMDTRLPNHDRTKRGHTSQVGSY